MRVRFVLLISIIVLGLLRLSLPAVAQAPEEPKPVVVGGVWELSLTYATSVKQFDSGNFSDKVTYTADPGYVFLQLLIKVRRLDITQEISFRDTEFDMSVVDANGTEFPLGGTGTGFNSYCMMRGCYNEYLLSKDYPASNIVYVFTVSETTEPNYTLKIGPDIAVPFTVPFIANFDAQFTSALATPITRANLWPITAKNAASLTPLSAHTFFGIFTEDFAFSADGSRLVGMGCDLYGKRCLSSAVRTWDLESGHLTATVQLGDTGSRGMYWMKLSPEGSRLLGSGTENIIIWDMETGDSLPSTIPAAPASDLIISPDGTQLAACQEDDSIGIWDIATGESLSTLPGPCGYGIFSPNGQWLAVYGGMPDYGGDGIIHVWDTVSGQAGPAIGGADFPVAQTVFAFNPDGTLLASGFPSDYAGDGIIHLWDIPAGTERAAWHQSETSLAVPALAFSPDGTLLISADENDMIHLWDVSTQQEIAGITNPNACSANELVFNAEGTLLALGCGGGTIEVWSASEEEAAAAPVIPTPTATPTVEPTNEPEATATTVVPSTPTEMPTPVSAAEASSLTLSYGESIKGALSESASSLSYRFEAQANDIVDITATAEDDRRLDLAMDLFGPDGELVATNDDTVRFNPSILGQELPAAGIYTVTVKSVEGEGNFVLALEGFAAARILYEEPFDNNDVYWETASSNTTISELRDGQYVIEYMPTGEHPSWIVAPGFDNPAAEPIFEPPYEIEFEVSDVFSRSSEYFISVLFNVQANYGGWLQLTISNDGAWGFFDTTVNAYVDYGSVEPIDFLDGNTHVLTARIFPSSYEFLVDNRLISSGQMDLTWKIGTVGFGIGSDSGNSKEYVEAHFDNLVVREIALATGMGESESGEEQAVPETAGAVDFTDDFHDNHNGWYNDRNITIQNGTLQIVIPEEDSYYYTSVPHASWNDFTFTVDAYSETEGVFSYGAWFRASPDLSDGYLFVVDPKDGYYALHLTEGGKWSEDVIPWTPSQMIKADEANQLGIKVSGNRIALTINGIMVYSITDTQFDTGVIALMATTYQGEVFPIAVQFDNLMITSEEPGSP